jgi:hypothetical protein
VVALLQLEGQVVNPGEVERGAGNAVDLGLGDLRSGQIRAGAQVPVVDLEPGDSGRGGDVEQPEWGLGVGVREVGVLRVQEAYSR